jgi:hypothetical protein
VVPRVEELVGRAQHVDVAEFAQLIGRFERLALAVAYGCTQPASASK